jgi:hypothetical protein
MTRRLFSWTLLVAGFVVVGCQSAPADSAEPSLREVRKNLAKALDLAKTHLTLGDLREEKPGQYVGEARDTGGVPYRVTATREDRRLSWKAEPDNLLPAPAVNIFGGSLPLEELPFEERHPEAMQWLRAAACAVQTAGVVWPLLGAFGWRRRYSPRTEKLLTIFAAVNLGCALLWGYQFVTNLGAN